MIYWTLQVPDQPTEVGFGDKNQFINWLAQRELGRTAPADWIVDVLADQMPDAVSRYTHCPGGVTLWSLTWGAPQAGAHDSV
jgi:hypothetical protein